jgi:hypothetical protein
MNIAHLYRAYSLEARSGVCNTYYAGLMGRMRRFIILERQNTCDPRIEMLSPM